jgi:hypothetical protein
MFGINYDLSASQVFENNTLTQNLNLLAQFDLNLNFRIARRFTVFGGFQLNGLLTNNLSNDATTFYSSIPANKVWYEKQFASQRTYIWPSFTIGVRI